ncbi:MAG: BCCT family transporter [Oscillospiraceae bacterium]|jgi:BCCT family betaine/carnitine transporter|nr:BCCT family transporter [Oscillospiraceae bacterium]
MSKESVEKKKNGGEIDWISIIIPLIGVLVLAIVFVMFPDGSENMLGEIRSVLGNDIGIYYILMGLFAFGATMYIAFSRYGKIKLGAADEKPQYKPFAWGAMIFTATMAADILFYSLSEWAMYATEPYVESMGEMQLWSPTFPLFHWGPIAWSFYIVLAAAFGFMLHVRGRSKQKFSEACRPILGNKVDGILGRIIDMVAIFSLIAGTATTFSLATPLLAGALAHVFGISVSNGLTICILLLIAIVYTIAVLTGMGGISKLASFSVYLFFAFLFYFLFLGGETRYIIETGVESIGNLIQNFIGLATRTDPLRESGWEAGTGFVQSWTIFYWAYWMAWCIATPFFIGMISKGRTLKNTVLGAYCWGLAGTFTSFIILGNYGLSQQMKHGLDSAGAIANSDWTPEAISAVVIRIFETLPLPSLALIILVINMIIFYATTFDALTMVISCYSHKKLEPGEEPNKKVRAFWAVLLILLPIGLIFSNSALQSLQSVAIIAAFPIGLVILLIVFSFFKDARKELDQ